MTMQPNRRAMLAGAAAISVAAFASIPALASPASTAEWDSALTTFREAEAAHDEAWDRWSAAEDESGEMIGDRPDELYEWGLGRLTSRDSREAAVYAWNRDSGITPAQVAAHVDRFEAYQRRFDEARASYNLGALYEAAQATNPRFHEARDALMAIAAPTIAALLVKIEIASVSLDDDHAEAMLADARRLLAGEA